MDRRLRLGCQTYTWEMLGDAYQDGPDKLLEMIAGAGYAGIEMTDRMIGHYKDSPQAFARALAQQGLVLVAYAVGSDSGFTEPAMLSADLSAAEQAIAFAGYFPGALVCFGSATIRSPGARDDKFAAAAAFYNAAGELGRRAGVGIALHPSSHHNTLLFNRADYDMIFARTDPMLIGWVPDTGHILRGHEDMLDLLRTYSDRIRYLHLKDLDEDGQWAMLDTGDCDLDAVVTTVRRAENFNGWLVIEEESDQAARDPLAAVKANRDKMREFGL
ncbi:sugar phosphate isomerase/epimerase [Acidisoma cellulosilytica]|uniref:Sugar phosphate isomerase/epimerase n=1 Tax=Acidisoma cellulosilyticum TaxID=2802395 RepID=A0A963Z504_9PROT|nr:sugar phosphate isomerase/epimerase [Acidisoma cellulosilyticum]MCB8882012.1 sugar phosphate isomerase/epimerase [Acidisoma cellulosilyticum]